MSNEVTHIRPRAKTLGAFGRDSMARTRRGRERRSFLRPLDLEPLSRLQGVGQPAQLRDELGGRVDSLNVPVYPTVSEEGKLDLLWVTVSDGPL